MNTEIIKKTKEWIFQTFYVDKLQEIEKLNHELNVLNNEYKVLNNNNLDLLTEIIVLNEELEKQNQLFDQGWDNPYGWKTYSGSFQTITGTKVPANSTLTPQDKKLKALALKLRGKDIRETAVNIEKYLHRYISYVYDQQNDYHPGFVEYFQTASLTWAIKKGDCDDYAILFATLMHILGYGDKVVVKCGKVIGSDDKPYGHAYNAVLIDNKWEIFDAQAGPSIKPKVTYKNTNLYFWFNYWGVYKGKFNETLE